MAGLIEFEGTYIGLMVAAAVSYAVLLLLVRWSGYRTIGEMSAIGMIVSITVGGAIGASLADQSISSLRGIVIAGTFITIEVLLSKLVMYVPLLRRTLSGAPVVLVQNGKVLEGNLRKHSLNVDQLVQQLRLQQAFHLSDVETAVLEPNGQVSVQFKADKAPLQPAHLGLAVTPAPGLGRIVINDGTVRQQQLYALGYSETWLMQELAKRGYTNLQEIVVAQLDASGNLYVDIVNDFRQTQQPQDKQTLLAGLQKLQADLAAYSVETEDEDMQQQFAAQADQMARVLERAAPHLKA